MAKIVLKDDPRRLSSRVYRNVRTNVEETLLENLSRHLAAIAEEERSREDVVEPEGCTGKSFIPEEHEYPEAAYIKCITVDRLKNGKLTWDYLYKMIQDADEAAFNAHEAAKNCSNTLSLTEETVNHCKKRFRTAKRKQSLTTDLRDSANFSILASKYQKALNLIVENAGKAKRIETSARHTANTTALVAESMFQNVEYDLSLLNPNALCFVVHQAVKSNKRAIDTKKAEWFVLRAMKEGWEIPDPELSADPGNHDYVSYQSDEICNRRWIKCVIFCFCSIVSGIMAIMLIVSCLLRYSLTTILATGTATGILTVFISIVKIYLHFSRKRKLAEITRIVIMRNEMLAFINTRIGELKKYFISNNISIEQHDRDLPDEDEYRLFERQDAERYILTNKANSNLLSILE